MSGGYMSGGGGLCPRTQSITLYTPQIFFIQYLCGISPQFLKISSKFAKSFDHISKFKLPAGYVGKYGKTIGEIRHRRLWLD